MNGPRFWKRRLLAERMIKEGGSAAADRLAFAFRLATGRQ
jgi:hypothetical protein